MPADPLTNKKRRLGDIFCHRRGGVVYSRAMRLALAVAGLALGCQVDAGTVPDAAPCRPSPSYFVTDVWLRYLDANQCATPACHGFDGGHGYLRFRPPGTPPDPAAPLDAWPAAWRMNYLAATQLVRCDDPLASRLLTVPEGGADPHPTSPADQVQNHADAEAIFHTWVATP